MSENSNRVTDTSEPPPRRRFLNQAAAAGLAAIVLGASGPAQAGKDLDAVKARGMVNCGVGTGTAGYMIADSQGKWRGLSVDVCRAVAAAIFGDAEKVRYIPLTSQQRFTALQSGEVDMTMGNATYTLTPAGDKTKVRFDLSVDPTVPLPGFILKRTLKGGMETATDGLRKQVLKLKKG